MIKNTRYLHASSIPLFFIIKVVMGLAVLKISATSLSTQGFALFSQLILFSSLLNMMVVGGTQTGLVREIAAATERSQIDRAYRAAIVIWTAASAIICVLIVLLSRSAGNFLVGDADLGPSIMVITLLGIASGPGQIYCAILTGQGRTTESMAAQITGLVAGGGAAIYMLHQGLAVSSVVAFASGSIITSIMSYYLTRGNAFKLFNDKAYLRGDTIQLLRFSLAFALTAMFSPASLFIVRYYYRESFGATLLSYWLVANRLSDTTTQLTGLLLVQLYLPALARADNIHVTLQIARKYLIITSSVAITAAVCFYVGSAQIVALTMSPELSLSSPGIFLYLLGDVVRVPGAILMYTAYGRNRLAAYVMIEFCIASSIALTNLFLIYHGIIRSPYYSYIFGHLIAALCSILIYMHYASTRTVTQKG